MGLTETEVAEAIAYTEKMLKQAAEGQILNGKNDQGKAKSEEALEEDAIDIDERTPFLRVRRATANAPDRMRALSIDPLAPSAAFDETLKERLREAKSRPFMLSCLGFWGYEPCEVCNQWRDVFVQDLPEDVEIYCIITMNQSVPQTDDLPPGDLRMPGAQLFRYSGSGFSYDF